MSDTTPPEAEVEPVEGYTQFLDLVRNRKEWQVTQQYDGTDATTDDIPPMLRAVVSAPFHVDVMVFCAQINRDDAIAAARVLGASLHPDFITLMADAHVTQEPINPATGQKWAPGEMQNACDVDGACAVGLLDDCLAVNTAWRDGRVRLESLVYTVTKRPGMGNSSIVWSGHAEHPTLDTKGNPEGMVASGYIPSALLAALDAPDLASVLGSVAGLDPVRLLRVSVMGAVQALAERGYALAVATQDELLAKRIGAMQGSEPIGDDE